MLFLFVSESLTKLSSTEVLPSFSTVNPNFDIVIAKSFALIVILLTIENTSKLKIWYAKIGDWINVISFLYGKTLKQSTLEKKLDDNRAEEYKKIYILCLEKRGEIKKSTQFKVEDVFADILIMESITGEQIPSLKFFRPNWCVWHFEYKYDFIRT